MQNQQQLRLCAALATLVAGSICSAALAEPQGRAAVIGRQQIRSELVVAMADGKLSRLEQYSIYDHAMELLPKAELPSLKRTLMRLGPPPAERKKQTSGDSDDAAPDTLSPDVSVEEGNEAEQVSYQEPAEGADEENPFREEKPTPVKPGVSETHVLAENGEYVFADGCVELEGRSTPGMFHLATLDLFCGVEGFKGPLDLDNRNGNFGTTFALNAGVPVAKRLGIGMQGGVSAVLTDFHGTEFTGDTIRVQDFITVGVFQRISRGGPNSLNWGFTYDWMADRYYSSMYMSQWRVQISYELNPFCEIGLWACIPDEGDFARVGSERFGYTTENFKPLPQGNFFIRRRWMNNFTATAWMGIIEEPGELVFGGDARVPISRHLSFVGSFNYVLPSANGAPGQDEEMWYVSVGIELAPFATGCRAFDEKFRPLFPLANNGTFSIRRF